jgi:opacity protein-like surface antigen
MGLVKSALVLVTASLVSCAPHPCFADAPSPSPSPESLNCADTAATIDAGLTHANAQALAKSLAGVWSERVRRRDWTHARDLSAYTLAFCRSKTGASRFITMDGIYVFLGAAVCDDAAGFAVQYDTETKQFGEFMFGVSACAPPRP